MRIESIPSGTRVGIDANAFVYHFTGASAQCTGILLRCERRDLQGFTSTVAIAEALHRLMILEALGKGFLPGANPTKRLKRNPELVRSLSVYARAGEAMLQMGVGLLSPTVETVRSSQRVRAQFGLLVNDSLIVATFMEHGITHLVTADQDFGRIDALTICPPTDLPK